MRHLLVIISALFFMNSSHAQSVKIMTYNIRLELPVDSANGWKFRKDFLVDQIKRNSPGILGIQEGLPQQVAYIDSLLPQYNFIGVGRDNGKSKGEYSAIFYDTTLFITVKSGTFWLSETPDSVSFGWDAAYRRVCSWALFQTKKTNLQFWVFNTHFDHVGDTAREMSAKLIVQKINELNKQSLPVVLTGDFNLTPNTKPIRYLSGVFTDTHRLVEKKPGEEQGTFNGFAFGLPATQRIDYIFTSNEVQILNYTILIESRAGRYPSDHFPVLAELSFKN